LGIPAGFDFRLLAIGATALRNTDSPIRVEPNVNRGTGAVELVA